MKTVTLSKKEIELINESCEYFMEILKDDSTFENPNNKILLIIDLHKKVLPTPTFPSNVITSPGVRILDNR